MSNKKDQAVRNAAREALAVILPPSKEEIPHLARLLESKRASVRANAAIALASAREKAVPALPSLVRALDDPNDQVVVCAAGTIIAAGGKRGSRWRRAADAPSGQGSGVGRGLHPGAGGRAAARQPGRRRRGFARGGAAAALRRYHQSAAASDAVVGWDPAQLQRQGE